MSSELIARETELTQALAAVRDAAGAAITGHAGVGKTTLARVVAQRACSVGDHVEWIVATAAGRVMPFGALAPLMPDDVTTLHPTLLLGAVARRMRHLGGRRPPLVVIDDAHLLDELSAATLLGLVTAGAARVVATIRSGERAPDAVNAVWKDSYVTSVAIEAFDRRRTGEFLVARLGGAVAVTTAELLWQQTRGNALYLEEITRHAIARGELVKHGGVWIWEGQPTVPTRLADLLIRRFDGLSPAGLDALGVLVLAEVATLETLDATAGYKGVAELEGRGLVDVERRQGSVWYRFAHPLLGIAAGEVVAPTQRRRLADLLSQDAAATGDLVRRATWQLDASGQPDVEVLLAAAATVMLSRPALAVSLAERALPYDPSPRAPLLLADARCELGDVPAARAAQRVAAERIRNDEDRFRVIANDVSVTTFSDRRPDLGLKLLEEARFVLPSQLVDLDSMAAQVTVFSARPREALAITERILATDPPRATEIRTRSSRLIALALVDRAAEARREAHDLVAYVAAGPVSPYGMGVAHLAAEFARQLSAEHGAEPASSYPTSGRWPIPQSAAELERRVGLVSHPLFHGFELLTRGLPEQALPLLYEAHAQQRAGEGLLRSEASALLINALAAVGRTAEAARIMSSAPPDGLALFPGLAKWAAAAIAGADGNGRASELLFDAAAESRRVGAVVACVAYLALASRFGATRQAAAELDGVGDSFETPVTMAHAVAIRARASGDGEALLDVGERYFALGMTGLAHEVVDMATTAMRSKRSPGRKRAELLLRETARRLDRPEDKPAVPMVRLTLRELEVAKLAANGMADRDIAGVLTVSVRTVESHLAAGYRKLGIQTRKELRSALTLVHSV